MAYDGKLVTSSSKIFQRHRVDVIIDVLDLLHRSLGVFELKLRNWADGVGFLAEACRVIPEEACGEWGGVGGKFKSGIFFM